MLATIKKRFGASWVLVGWYDALHYELRCVHGDDFGIYVTGDLEVVGKSEWEKWG